MRPTGVNGGTHICNAIVRTHGVSSLQTVRVGGLVNNDDGYRSMSLALED